MGFRRRSGDVYEDAFKDPALRAELSIEELVKRQIERTNVAASYDKRIFASNIGVLKALLPAYSRRKVEEKASDYIVMNEFWRYKYNCGVPVGTPEHPVMGSPELIEEADVDWDKLYEIILDEFETCGISWKIDHETIVLGKWRPKEKKKQPPPTPWYGDESETKKLFNLSDDDWKAISGNAKKRLIAAMKKERLGVVEEEENGSETTEEG